MQSDPKPAVPLRERAGPIARVLVAAVIASLLVLLDGAGAAAILRCVQSAL
jgi:Mg2+/citrate symporter